MSIPGHTMSLARTRLAESNPGTYRAEIQFVMAGPWTIEVTASQPHQAPARARVHIEIPLNEAPGVPASG